MLNKSELTASLPKAAEIVSVEEENSRTRTFTLDVSWPEAYPGQFLMAWLPGVNEKPFSLLDSNPIRITVAAVGRFSKALHELSPGDTVWVRGPLGHGFSLEKGTPILVAGGYGVSPLAFLARRWVEAGIRVWAIVGARTERELLFLDRFRKLGTNLLVTTEDGSAGERGLVTDALIKLLGRIENPYIYACGPGGMLEAIRRLCKEEKFPCQLSWEAYMRCGFGVCGSCARKEDGWLVCKDGPVEKIEPNDSLPLPRG